jgi:hypothetical protein
MKIFRENLIRNIFALFTGLIFLNMSFFLFEVSLLKLNEDRQMMANIAKMLCSGATEEERDVFGGGSDEDSSTKEIDLLFSYTAHTVFSYITSVNNKMCVVNQGIPLLGSYEIYSPPPEFNFF